MKFSLEGKVALAVGSGVVLATTLAVFIERSFESRFAVWIVTLSLALPFMIVVAHRMMAPVNDLFRALRDGVSSLRDGDFSTSVATRRRDELGELVEVYNGLGDVLRRERQSLFQRELLLDTVIQTTPLALVLCNRAGRIVYSNTSARRLFIAGKPLNGHDFGSILAAVDAGFGQAVAAQRDGLFTIDEEGDPHTYHLSCREFTLNGQPHRLYVFKQLTHELSRQEVATWKKVIRVISHELNNSLAPISSLAHSGRLLVERPDRDKLDAVLSTIEERSAHLKTFIEGYARFARLPAPRLERVDLAAFVASLRNTVSFESGGGAANGDGDFDPGQMERVLINLLKNAHESGSAPGDVRLDVSREGAALRFEVRDRGSGMSETVLRNALLPFYSTKQTGTGLGLPLCREIVEAHGGRLAIANRSGGGLRVSVVLPAAA